MRRAWPDLDAADPPRRWRPETIEKLGKNTPLCRPGQPTEVTPVHVPLASNGGGYITGATILATGGYPVL